MFKQILHIAVCAVVLAGCKPATQPQNPQAENEIKQASILSISHRDGFTQVDVKNPWTEGKTLHTYILVPRNAELPDDLPEGTVVRTPIERALVHSSVHACAMRDLGKIDAVKGVCDAEYYKIPEITEGLTKGTVTNAGSSMQPNIEKILEMQPDAIIVSPYQNAGYGAVETLGIPIIECADYMENTPLGRAEWMKLFGALLGCEEAADSIFESTCSEYEAVRSQADAAATKPTIISEMVLSGVWFVPGGNSYMAKMFADAGGSYPWSDNNESGSLQLDFSQVLNKAKDADVWVLKSSAINTYDDLAKAYELNSEFDAFKNRRAWVCNTTTTNLFEEFPFHPERLLRDFFIILHPELAGAEAQTTYYKPLAE